jgi:poly-gamma-glutamate capsule biosynthesis protein CapA/YwtB (metallophosphatase superfamily)
MNKEDLYAVGLSIAVLAGVLWLGNSSPIRFSDNPKPLSNFQTTEKPITILVGGDVNMGRNIGKKILAGDIDYPFAKISDTLKDADITFVNLESQLADLGGETQSPTNEFRFAGPPESAQSLKNAGIDIVSVANNHMWDYGKDRLFETLDSLDKNGVKYVGASQNPDDKYGANIIEVNKKKIAFLAMTTLLNGYENSGATEYVSFNNSQAIVAEINRIRLDVDYVFVSIHTGTEYQTQPGDAMIELSHKLIDAGADGIIGHHPHVPQPIEIYNGKPIFYSLGNFAFWQPFSFWTQHAYLARITLDKGNMKYEVIPVNSGWQPSLLTDSDSINKLMELLNTPIRK